MAESKQVQFLRGLCDKTTSGKVRWESGDEKTFLAFLGEYAVEITRFYDAAVDPEGESHEVRIVDAEGEEIDSFDATDFVGDERGIANRMLRELYNAARRKALGVNEVYDKILTELGAE